MGWGESWPPSIVSCHGKKVPYTLMHRHTILVMKELWVPLFYEKAESTQSLSRDQVLPLSFSEHLPVMYAMTGPQDSTVKFPCTSSHILAHDQCLTFFITWHEDQILISSAGHSHFLGLSGREILVFYLTRGFMSFTGVWY